MRPLTMLFSASLLAIASSANAQNQSLPYPQADDAAISTVEVTAPAKLRWVKEEQAWKIGGGYAMSNGWYLKVKPTLHHIVATIDDQKPMRLAAVSDYKFVSSDGNVIMEFNKGADGDDMVMSYIPDRRTAQRVTVSALVAQR